jgi:hypothetical protein
MDNDRSFSPLLYKWPEALPLKGHIFQQPGHEAAH